MFGKVFSLKLIMSSFSHARWLLLICALAVSLPVPAYMPDDIQKINPQDAKKLLKKAKKLERRGRIRQAEKILRQIIARYPQNNEANLALAHLLLKQKRLIEAYNYSFEVAKRNEKNSYAFAILGVTYLNAGNFKQARIYLNNALTLSKKESLAWAGIGMMHFYENRPDAAIRCLRMAVYREPSEADFLFTLGQIAARTERYREAAEAYEKFLIIAPDNDTERKERIKGLTKFLRYLGNQTTLYGLSGGKETSVPFDLVENRPVITLKLKRKGKPLRFVLDTGSGMTVVSESTAKRLGLKKISRGGKARAIGGSGKFEIVYGFLKTVRIGDIRVRNVPVYIRKFHNRVNKVDGYIGLSLISKYITTIDYGSQTFSLVKKKVYNQRPPMLQKDAMTLPLRLTSSGFLSGEVKLQGFDSPFNFIVDTGASVSVISEELANSQELQDHELKQTMKVVGAAGITDNVPIFSLPHVSFGKFSRKSLRAVALDLNLINEASGYEQAGILGGNFLRNYSLTFDFEKSKVTFVPNKN